MATRAQESLKRKRTRDDLRGWTSVSGGASAIASMDTTVSSSLPPSGKTYASPLPDGYWPIQPPAHILELVMRQGYRPEVEGPLIRLQDGYGYAIWTGEWTFTNEATFRTVPLYGEALAPSLASANFSTVDSQTALASALQQGPRPQHVIEGQFAGLPVANVESLGTGLPMVGQAQQPLAPPNGFVGRQTPGMVNVATPQANVHHMPNASRPAGVAPSARPGSGIATRAEGSNAGASVVGQGRVMASPSIAMAHTNSSGAPLPSSSPASVAHPVHAPASTASQDRAAVDPSDFHALKLVAHLPVRQLGDRFYCGEPTCKSAFSQGAQARAYRSAADVRKHQRCHIPKELWPHVCNEPLKDGTLCQERAMWVSHMTEHKDRKHGNLSFWCPYCPANEPTKAARFENLVGSERHPRHIRIKHPGMPIPTKEQARHPPMLSATPSRRPHTPAATTTAASLPPAGAPKRARQELRPASQMLNGSVQPLAPAGTTTTSPAPRPPAAWPVPPHPYIRRPPHWPNAGQMPGFQSAAGSTQHTANPATPRQQYGLVTPPMSRGASSISNQTRSFHRSSFGGASGAALPSPSETPSIRSRARRPPPLYSDVVAGRPSLPATPPRSEASSRQASRVRSVGGRESECILPHRMKGVSKPSTAVPASRSVTGSRDSR